MYQRDSKKMTNSGDDLGEEVEEAVEEATEAMEEEDSASGAVPPVRPVREKKKPPI